MMHATDLQKQTENCGTEWAFLGNFFSETTFLKSTSLNISKVLETLRLTKMLIKDKIQTKSL